MSKTLTFEVPDELYAAFQQAAVREGRTTEAVALEWLAKHTPKPHPLRGDVQRTARERLQRHIGVVSLGHPTGADSASIDADLAREYGNTHTEEK